MPPWNPSSPHTAPVLCGRAALWAVVWLMTGCHSGVYQPSNLPLEYAANPVVNVQSLDLSHLARPVASSHMIGPGDTLLVTLISGVDNEKPTSWELTVGDDGMLQVPLVGQLPVAGHDVPTAQNVIRTASIQRGIFRQPSISLSVKQQKTNRVTVLGAVNKTGVHELPAAASDLLSALVAAGGLNESADTVIEIRRARPSGSAGIDEGTRIATASYDASGEGSSSLVGPMDLHRSAEEIVHVDLIAATQQPSHAGGFLLGDGDVVVVRQRSPRYIQVMGIVHRPDQFELPHHQNVRLLDALAMAGGPTVSLADEVLITRQAPGVGTPVVIEASIAKARKQPQSNLLLMDGDVVHVKETPITFLLDAIRSVVRVGVNGSISAL